MRKSRLTEARIIGMIKGQEAGLPTVDPAKSVVDIAIHRPKPACRFFRDQTITGRFFSYSRKWRISAMCASTLV
ncbi:hypothetical protein KRZ98_11950 [Sphingobium sp. AS12]|jgi:hypothetical protein|uniref:hypothetical protein n=1 Tax=Sphingobium sp. AS12 TaxID=2849495 RepID=UPI001C31B391|nr:hypothetical protein [Sphingobium sp. AS12]MBV2148995.1 hypothetical protein [Sphingobium sp. AS12]